MAHDTMKDKSRGGAGSSGGSWQDTKEEATSALGKVGETVSKVAENVTKVAENVSQGAQQMASKAYESAQQAASRAADSVSGGIKSVTHGVESAAEYVHDKGVSGMADDITGIIRRHPLPAVLVALGIGFMLASVTRR